MLVEEQKLRWCGMDMRPRWRRRMAVLLTYFLIFLLASVISQWSDHPVWATICFWPGTYFIFRLSVMGEKRLVKSFEERKSFRVRGFGEMAFVEGLDEWAQYFYGVASFDAAMPKQKEELLSRFKMGKFMFPAKPGTLDAPWLDERERFERDSAERWSRKAVLTLLGCYAGTYASRGFEHKKIESLEVSCEFFMFAVLLSTLPMARVLWTEPNPREFADGMTLVPSPRREA